MLTLLMGKQSRVSLSPSPESPQTLATVSTDNALDVTITAKYAYYYCRRRIRGTIVDISPPKHLSYSIV